MRKWTVGLLALAGSALVAVPGAMAQSEFGNQYSSWVWDEYGGRYYYTPPGPAVIMAPPAVAAPNPGPTISYFSPPAGAPAQPPAVAVGPGPGECGTFRYWSPSLSRCVDARAR